MPQMKERVLPQTFYARDPRLVARELLGKVLVRTLSSRARAQRLSGRIVEVEVYLGEGDLAAHSAAGQTQRNHVLFGPPGHAYVYFIYGVHYCLNISCMPEGEAGCVLIRALEPLTGIPEMATARDLNPFDPTSVRDLRKLLSGPGKLCEALGITRPRDNDKDMLSPQSNLQVGDDGFHPVEILETPRIGITKSADMPLR